MPSPVNATDSPRTGSSSQNEPSTNLPSGVPWVNQHDKTGLVVSPGDADGLRRALLALLTDRPRRAALGHCARQRVDREFTLRRMAKLTGGLYREVLAERAANT